MAGDCGPGTGEEQPLAISIYAHGNVAVKGRETGQSYPPFTNITHPLFSGEKSKAVYVSQTGPALPPFCWKLFHVCSFGTKSYLPDPIPSLATNMPPGHWPATNRAPQNLHQKTVKLYFDGNNS